MVASIFENVPPLGIVSSQVHEDARVVCQHLGQPVAIDAAALGSYAHRLRWKWTNLAHMPGISAALRLIDRPKGRQVDHILDEGRHAQAVVQEDQSPLALVNQVGQSRLALPTLVSYPRSYAFQNGGPGLVFDTKTQGFMEPCADERDRAMGFPTGTTRGPGVTEFHRCQILGQAMDLTSMVWFLGICLAAQRYINGGLGGHLGAEASGQGAVSVVPLVVQTTASPNAKVWHDSRQAWDQVLKKMRAQDAVEWLVADDLRGQRVLSALAQEWGMEDAQEKFKRVFFARQSPYLTTSPQSVDGLATVDARARLVGVSKGVDASIVLDKGKGAHSSN